MPSAAAVRTVSTLPASAHTQRQVFAFYVQGRVADTIVHTLELIKFTTVSHHVLKFITIRFGDNIGPHL